MAQSFDAIVLGAGGMGSAAAYYLAKAGQRVLVLEQFELDHQKGGSYGVSRVIRYAYDHPLYIELVRAAFALWFALEEAAGEALYTQTGGLDIGLPELPSFQRLKASMTQAEIPYELLSPAAVRDRFPQFCLDNGMEGVYQPAAGMLAASRCVWAHLRLAQAKGAVICDRTPVCKLLPQASSVTVYTSKETYHAERLVITAGSWAGELLSTLGIDLPLQVMPAQLAFFQPNCAADYQPGRFPVFMIQTEDENGHYGLPMVDNTGVKFSTFYGWETLAHPSQVDYTPSEAWIKEIQAFLNRYLPGANGKLLSSRRCLYSLTPDKHFVIDRHPEYPHIAFATGFSGHGFKFTTLVGNLLTELLLEGSTPLDIRLFSYSRFSD
ncbi:N-methyl-L-tryptophan oxidase [Phormidium tenue FACHB-886]|nr:N-methyl-L-tryptophan oxidase [Phormidium tenue FACHB-886]